MSYNPLSPPWLAHSYHAGRGKVQPFTDAELAAINDRLRTAYQLVEEVEALIKRVPWPMMSKYQKARQMLFSVGENLNNRIDWRKDPMTRQPAEGEAGDDLAR